MPFQFRHLLRCKANQGIGVAGTTFRTAAAFAVYFRIGLARIEPRHVLRTRQPQTTLVRRIVLVARMPGGWYWYAFRSRAVEHVHVSHLCLCLCLSWQRRDELGGRCCWSKATGGGDEESSSLNSHSSGMPGTKEGSWPLLATAAATAARHRLAARHSLI